MTDQEPEEGSHDTLESFADYCLGVGRTVSVWVNGDPPTGRSTAVRTAAMLTPGDGTVVEPSDFCDVSLLKSADTVLFTGLDVDERLISVFSTKPQANVVVHVDGVPEHVKRLVDVRVVVDGEEIEAVRRIRVNAYNGNVYEVDMDGFGEVDNAE